MQIMADTTSCVPQEENPCNSSKILKILSFRWPQDVMDIPDSTIDIQQPLNHLQGYSIDIVKDFLHVCPRNVTLILENYFPNGTSDYDYIRNWDFDLIINQWDISLVMLRGGYLFSQNSYISDVALVYDPASRSKSESVSSSIFYNFLSPNAGFGLLAFFLLAIIIFGLIVLAERQNGGGGGSSNSVEPSGLAWNLTCAILNAMDNGAFRGTVWRLFAISWLFLWLIITMMFSSHMSSTMTVEKIRRPIHTLDDLARSNHEFFWNNYIKLKKHPTFNKLRQRYETFKTPLMERAEKRDKNATTELLREGKIMITNWFSFMGSINGGKDKICDYTILKDKSFLPHISHMVFSQQAQSLMAKFNLYLKERTEDGTLKEWQDRWLDGVCNNGEPRNGGASVEWHHIQHAVIAAASGILGSGILAFIKFCCRKN